MPDTHCPKCHIPFINDTLSCLRCDAAEDSSHSSSIHDALENMLGPLEDAVEVSTTTEVILEAGPVKGHVPLGIRQKKEKIADSSSLAATSPIFLAPWCGGIHLPSQKNDKDPPKKHLFSL